MIYDTFSDKQTKDLAKKLAKDFSGGVIALLGNLGSGKTTFVQGFAEGLGIKDKIISPTFVLMKIHKIPKSEKTLPARRQLLYHIDLYRLEGNQFEGLGLEEIINDRNNIVLIEWAEKIKNLLPKNTTWIYFENLNEDKRRIIVK